MDDDNANVAGEAQEAVPFTITPTLDHHYQFSHLEGFFIHPSDPENQTLQTTHFGLVVRSYPTDTREDNEQNTLPWRRFLCYLNHLNATAESGEYFKLFFCQRHGQGWHNLAESKVGVDLWNSYYSYLDGVGEISWSDAELTPLGKEQAKTAGKLWRAAIYDVLDPVPTPHRHLVSPHRRAIDTAYRTWQHAYDTDTSSSVTTTASPSKPHQQQPQFMPIAWEWLRENVCTHTCDRRSDAAALHKQFPTLSFERGFADQDPMWRQDWYESVHQQRARAQVALDRIFSEMAEVERIAEVEKSLFNSQPAAGSRNSIADDGVAGSDNSLVSITSHNGQIEAVQRAIGIAPPLFTLPGSIAVFFVKGSRVEGVRDMSGLEPPYQQPIGPKPEKELPADFWRD